MTDWEMVELGGVKIGKKSFNWVSAAQGIQKKAKFSDFGFSSKPRVLTNREFVIPFIL